MIHDLLVACIALDPVHDLDHHPEWDATTSETTTIHIAMSDAMIPDAAAFETDPFHHPEVEAFPHAGMVHLLNAHLPVDEMTIQRPSPYNQTLSGLSLVDKEKI